MKGPLHLLIDIEPASANLGTTTAKLHDARVWDALRHGVETSVWADKGYVSAESAAAIKGPGKVWGVRR